MTTYRLTPVLSPVFNEIDQHGLLLGLTRLEGERNAEYKQRILDVLVNKGGSNYLGLIYAITRETGLKINNALTVTAVTDGNGNTLATNPAVVFKETKCYLYNDFVTQDILLTIDRYNKLDAAYTLEELVTVINSSGKYTATLTNKVSPTDKSMIIYNQTSLGSVIAEDITGKGHRVRLENTNLVSDSVSISSSNLLIKKSTPVNLRTGEYYVDMESGTIISAQSPNDGSLVRYQYKNNTFTFKSSPIIIHNLQSDDFKTKMFETQYDEDGNPIFGLPNTLGAEIINELLSVFPSNYGV
jgi:hypothetical protein